MKIRLTNPFNKKRYELVLRREFIKELKPAIKKGVRTIKVKDTYVAAYYISMEATLKKVRELKFTPKKARRKGYPRQWIMTLTDVPLHAVSLYQAGKAISSVDDLAGCRRRLKRGIKRLLK